MAIEYLVYPSFTDLTNKGTYGHGFYHALDLQGFEIEEVDYFFKHLSKQEKMREILEKFVNTILERAQNEPKLIAELKRTQSQCVSFSFKNPFGNRKLDIIFDIRIEKTSDGDRIWVDDCRVKTLKGITVGRFRRNIGANNVYVSHLS